MSLFKKISWSKSFFILKLLIKLTLVFSRLKKSILIYIKKKLKMQSKNNRLSLMKNNKNNKKNKMIQVHHKKKMNNHKK